MTITEQMAEALKPFAEACTNAEISGYPPGNFVDASAYEKARAALIAASAASPKGEQATFDQLRDAFKSGVEWWRTNQGFDQAAEYVGKAAYDHADQATGPREPEGPTAMASVAHDMLHLLVWVHETWRLKFPGPAEALRKQVDALAERYGEAHHPLPPASFQAGAEAMREAAAKVCQRWLDNYSNLAIDYSTPREYATGAVLDIKEVIEALPIPASSEGR